MSHEDISAALTAATPGPWQVYESMQADTFVYGPRGILRDDIIAGPTYNRENAHLIAHAPEWLADLLGEVDLLRTLKHRHEQTITELAARAEAAEQAVQRVRELAESWATQPNDYDEDTEQQIEDGNAILRALDGGE